MKAEPQEHIFRKPVKLVQVFSNMNEYTKNEKPYKGRVGRVEWGEIKSKSGHIGYGVLYLPEAIIDDIHFSDADVITLEDKNNPDYPYYEPYYSTQPNHCFNMQHPRKLDIFRLAQGEQELELHLEYQWAAIGDPKRNDFKLCELIKNKPVEIRINGKYIGRRQNSYREVEYILEYVGDFDRCYLLKESAPVISKRIPSERKLVDLNELLW